MEATCAKSPSKYQDAGPAAFWGALGKDIPRWQEPERVGLDQARLGGKKEAIALNAHHRGTKIFLPSGAIFLVGSEGGKKIRGSWKGMVRGRYRNPV